MLELATYYRFYYKRDLTLTLECLSLFVLCLLLDVMIWRAHWSMTNDDPGFLNDSKSIVEASKLDQSGFQNLIETTITKITGLKPDSDKWPCMMIKRCHDCGILKTNHVHHCSMCDKCVFMMDHHCCFSDRCVGYYSMKSFVLFTGSVCLLTLVGMTTIWFNLTIRNVAANEGLVSFYDCIVCIIFQSPRQGFSFGTVYDMVLVQVSMFHGLFAFGILC